MVRVTRLTGWPLTRRVTGSIAGGALGGMMIDGLLVFKCGICEAGCGYWVGIESKFCIYTLQSIIHLLEMH
jgi:hypothetical protein